MSDVGGKRKGEREAGGKHKKQKYFSSGNKAGGGIPLNSRGVLVSTVVGKESVAAREVVTLLTEALERLHPSQRTTPAVGPPADTSDISALIASEVAELKDATKQTFYWHNTGINSVVYVELKDAEAPAPTELVVEVCRWVQASGQAHSRFVNRLYPVERACFASMEKIGELAAAVAAEHFGEGAAPVQFAVQFDHRAAPPLDRMKVINLFADQIKLPHKVNLSSPDKTIVVNLLKNACGVAVVERYKELSKFNLHEIVKKAAAGSKQGGSSEAGGQGSGGGGSGGGAAKEGPPTGATVEENPAE